MKKAEEISLTRFQLVGSDGMAASDSITVGTTYRIISGGGSRVTLGFDLLEAVNLVATRNFSDVMMIDPSTGRETGRWNSLVDGGIRTISGIVGNTVSLNPGH